MTTTGRPPTATAESGSRDAEEKSLPCSPASRRLLPPTFTLATYRFTLTARDALRLPPFKGSALRGGFGHTFKRLVCFQPWPCGDHCERGNACPYGYIFETAVPENSEVLRTQDEVPRPFVIEPPDDRRTLIPSGDRLTFGLTLIGRGINYLPYFIAVFKELGQVGLGRTRGKYRLLAVDAVSTLTPTPSPYQGEGWGEGGSQPVYRADDDMIRTTNLTITSDAIAAYAATLCSSTPPLPCPPAPAPPCSPAPPLPRLPHPPLPHPHPPQARGSLGPSGAALPRPGQVAAGTHLLAQLFPLRPTLGGRLSRPD